MVHTIVGLVNRLLVRRSGVRILAGEKNLLKKIHTGYGAHPSRPFNGCRRFISRVNQPGREFGHLPPSNAEDKMSGAIPLLLLYALVAYTGRTSRLLLSS